MIYFHGFASGPGSEKAQFFRRRFAECAIDLEIPDLDEGDFENLTLTGQLRVIERVVQGRPVSLIGSSMGGYLAALYAARHPEVERLVLMAPAFGFARLWTGILGAEKFAGWRRTGSLEMYHYGEKRLSRVGYQLIEDGERYEDYPDFAQPALIFHGSRDDAVPVEYSREFAAARANVQLEILDSGHELLDVLDLIWEKARRFCTIMHS